MFGIHEKVVHYNPVMIFANYNTFKLLFFRQFDDSVSFTYSDKEYFTNWSSTRKTSTPIKTNGNLRNSLIIILINGK